MRIAGNPKIKFLLKVVEIDDEVFYAEDINKEDSNYKSTWSDIVGIKITEELLLNNGFEKGETPTEYFHENLTITLRIEDDFWEEPCLDVFKKDVYLTCVEFVHELQNLLSALGEQEIKFDLSYLLKE